ncbi:hypothetical protein PCANC_01663 [Puccinia coronata f. sp. avenae]|uniref:Uncharacterized protein n=1 Tax=Puccinia coronata f. sp. avenae TaxID=200324 RepID=A0A2N5SJP8_9BASI|nr:hypothetical protein PCANC_16826 [Puccinia coronata f. sp. avenae]PLW20460.1 hypothetical protein PCASD_16671 [Puccinia coronata f. sp. avenae]PLW56719.1 hypothetical protein PCANC_01663 [Puccinia coronata f. sp. avenae]
MACPGLSHLDGQAFRGVYHLDDGRSIEAVHTSMDQPSLRCVQHLDGPAVIEEQWLKLWVAEIELFDKKQPAPNRILSSESHNPNSTLKTVKVALRIQIPHQRSVQISSPSLQSAQYNRGLSSGRVGTDVRLIKLCHPSVLHAHL